MEWNRPSTTAEAMALLAAGSLPVGGAASLMSAALPGRLQGSVVDLMGVLASDVSSQGIGAGMTLAELARHVEVRVRWPAVAAAAAATATPQVRELATLGGTVAARLANSDLAAALVAHGGIVMTQQFREAQATPYPVVDYLRNGGPCGHLVTAVALTVSGPGAYRRFSVKAGPTPALATVAGVREPTGEVRLWAGACGLTPAPIRVTAGGLLDEEQVRSDARASAPYRRRIVAVLAGEVLEELGARD